jgi:hypothetical protein
MPVAPDPQGGTVTAPYPAHSLKPPLTQAQRTSIIVFLESSAGKSHSKQQIADYINGKHASNPDLDIAFYVASGKNSGNENMDQAIITAYDNVLSGGDFTAPGPGDVHKEVTNPFSGWEDAFRAFIGAITSKQFWIRAGEFVAGAGLIFVAARAALTPGKG